MEKRVFQRMPLGSEVRISHNKKIYSGIVLNISEKGMFICTRERFPTDSIIRIESELFKMYVRVKRLSVMNGYYDGVGVELTLISKNYLEIVESLKAPLYPNTQC